MTHCVRIHFIVGHKSDSDDKDREVKKEEAQAIAMRYGMINYIEASSKDDLNVDQVLHLLNLSIRHRNMFLYPYLLILSHNIDKILVTHMAHKQMHISCIASVDSICRTCNNII